MSDNILVAVRVRPLITREVSDASAIQWQTGTDNTITQIDPATQKALCAPYTFDRVYSSDYSNADIYFKVAEPIVESALAGFNGTIFAYGQTSSGKTFTMMGNRDLPGIIPMAIQNIFNSIENTPDREYLIRVSYMEIYNENITDLLASRESRGKSLSVREDISGNVYVADLKEECVNCEESLLALMRKGDKNRHVGVTNMNERSSRSHTIFRIILESRERTEGDGSDSAVVVSQLNLVDLAGSENASQTGATGERLKEGGFINRSLFMLGRVISQLSDGEQFVNFRDSKLTRILQLSLGGNAKTAIICTVTPAAVDQTHSTLRFASRAKSIKNKPIVNEVLSEAALLKRYAKEIKKLKESLEKERNTDKAQEVEQVREMLDEQSRKNEDLQAKVTELKTMLVVSSLPKETDKKIIDKKKRLRRETWAAPAGLRAMRRSIAPLRIEPLHLDHEFVRPELPPWKDMGTLAEESSNSSQSPPLNSSSASDGFGRDDLSFNMDMAEQSKLGKLESSFNTPEILGTKRKRRVQFNFNLPPSFIDAECQTEESLLPKINLLRSPYPSTPKRGAGIPPGSPGTPAHVLRARNTELKQKLEEQNEWLEEWQAELSELKDFQKVELELLEESFQLKVADGPIDNTKLDAQAKEISSLKHSLKDSETLLLDANRALCQRTQDLASLQEQYQELVEENERRCGYETELFTLREENKLLKKSMEEKERSLNQFKNEKQDFDMMMELALEKQKGKESDLRRSLEAAWEEIANHESTNVDAVRRRSMHVSQLEKEVDELRENQAEVQELKSSNAELKQQLEASQQEQQATQQLVNEQNLKLQEMMILVDKLRELDEQVSRIETLESELLRVQSELESKEQKNLHLQETANALQMQLEERESQGTATRIRELEEEIENLRDSAVGNNITCKPLQLLNATQGDCTTVSSEISRKLSETLQVLEESIMLPSTPNRGSVSSMDEPFFQMQDFIIIKQQLLALQESLLAQEQQQQLQQQKFEDHIKEDILHKQLYHSQIIAEMESQINSWKMAEALCADYIAYSHAPFTHTSSKVYAQSVHTHESYDDNVAQEVHKAVKEAKEQVQAEYEAILKEERTEFEARLKKESKMGKDSLQAATLSIADELKGAGMNMTLCNETFETSILNLESDSSLQEVQKLKQQLDLLNRENSALLDQVKQLSEVHGKKREVQNYSNVPQSLADELHQAGMNMTMNICDESFETSILNLGADSSIQEISQLKHQLELLNQENVNLTEQVKQLELQKSESQKAKEQVEIELQGIMKEKEVLKASLKSMEEELSDSRIISEECHSLRWQVNSLKQDKSDLEVELKLMQEENENLEQTINDSMKKVDTNEDNIPEKVTDPLEGEHIDDSQDLHKAEKQMEDLKNDSMKKVDTNEDNIPEKITDPLEGEHIDDSQDLHKAEKQTEDLEEELKRHTASTEAVEAIAAPQIESEEHIINESCKMDDADKLSEDMFGDEDTDQNVKETRNTVEELRKKLEDQATALEEARKKILTFEETCQLDSGEIMSIKELVESNQELREKLREKSEELEETFKKMEELQSAVVCEESIEHLKKELTIAKEKIVVLECQIEKKESDFDSKISEIIAEKDSEMEMFITNFSDKEEALEEKLKELESANSHVVEMRKTLASKELEVQNLVAECNTLKTTFSDLEKQLLEEQNKSDEIASKYEIMQKENSDSSIETENRIQEFKNIIAGHETDLADKAEQLEEMKKCMEHQKELLVAAEAEKQEFKEISERKVLQESHNASIKIETEKTLDRDDHSILGDKLDELKHLKEEYSTKVREHKELQDSMENLRIVLSKKEKELETLNSEHEQEVSSYIENLNNRDEKIQELESVISQRNEERTNMVMALEAKDHKVQRLTSELEESHQSLQNKEREFQLYLDSAESDMSSKVKELQAEVEHLNKLHNELCEDRKNMAEAIKSKEDIVETLRSEQCTLKNELETLNENLMVTREKLKVYEDEVNEKNNIITELESEQEKLKNDILALKSQEENSKGEEVKKLVGIIEKYENEISEKEERLQSISKVVEVKDSHISNIEKEILSLQKRNEDMSEELEEFKEVKERYSQLEKEVTEHKRDSLTVADGLREKVLFLENSLSELNVDYKHKVEKLEEEISSHLFERENLYKKLSESEIKLDEINTELSDVQEKLAQTTKALDEKTELIDMAKCTEDQLNSKIQNLEEDLETCSSCLTSKEVELEKQKETICLLAEEKLKLEDEIADLRAQGKALDDQLESNNTQIEELVRIIEKYETETSEKDVQIQKYEMDRSEKEEQLQNLVTEIDCKESSIKEAEKTILSLHEKNQEMLDKLLELEGLRDKYCKLEKELEEHKHMKTSLEDLPEKLRNTEKNLAILQVEYEEEIQRYKTEIAEYVSQHEEVVEKLSQTEDELQNFKEQIQILKKELLEKENELEMKEKECARLDSEHADAFIQLRRTETEVKRLKEEINLYRTEQEEKGDQGQSAQHELSIKLNTEEDLQHCKEQLHSLQRELKEKEESLKEKELECTRLDLEMDDIVQHFKKEGQTKADMISDMTKELTKVQIELTETKQKLTDSMMICKQTTKNDGDDTVGGIDELQNQITELKEELKSKDEECIRLNAEMDDIVEHYKKEGASYGSMYNEISDKLKKTENDLSLTKSKLMEFSRQENSVSGDSSLTVQYLREQLQDHEKQLEVLMKEKEGLQKEIDTLKTHNKNLEYMTEKMSIQVEEVEQVKASLQEELKVSSDTVDTLLERLGDMDKFKLVYEEEKAVLEKQLKDYQQRVEMLMVSASGTKDAMQQVEMMEKINQLECDLQASQKNFEDVADEVNRWKQEYTRQYEECEGLKAKLVKAEFLMDEQKEKYEEELSQLSTRLNTLVNSSSMTTPGLNTTGKKKKTRASDMEEQRNQYILLCSEREEKIKELEKTLENLRRSQGVISNVEEFQRELAWMKEKMEAAEKERDLLNSNFDSLEKDYEQLQRENEELQASSERGSFTETADEVQQLKKKIEQLSNEKASLKNDSGVMSKNSSASVEEEASLRDRLVVIERENNELRFRLRALNAPAEKEVQNLREELAFANQKVTHLKAELRRLQNNKYMDSTICEMKGSHHIEEAKAEHCEGGSFDYSSGSGVVMEVQVLGLKNMVYHLEKDKKQLQNECKIMEQHVDHYKKKAQEWKDTAMKEKKLGEKITKELESKRAEIKQYQTAIEENRSSSERQKFELGQHRETIAKLEKEKQEHLQKMHADSTAVTSNMRRQTILGPVKEVTSDFSKGATNYEEVKSRSASLAPSSTGSQLHLGTHNAPLPSQTRIERLPGAKIPPAEAQKTDGKVPMWQSLNKENKDYSKYYLPSSTKKKQEEECKTQ
ncbi:centromere-associated protein E [Penaeus vannamei]|uniref:centromere-associated protein E n=1 Tax=Penaeus vannamei TaxID=6689 RepID=UPI00387F96BB